MKKSFIDLYGNERSDKSKVNLGPYNLTEFIKDPFFIGHTWEVGTYHKELFPFWRKTLVDLFDDQGLLKYNHILLTGARGTGKSDVMSKVIAPYLLYNFIYNNTERVLFNDVELRDKKFVFLFYNPVRTLARNSRDSFLETIDKSEFFRNHLGISSKFWDHLDFKVCSKLEELDNIKDIILYTFIDESPASVKMMNDIFDKFESIRYNTEDLLKEYNISLVPSVITASNRKEAGFAYELKLIEEAPHAKVLAPRHWEIRKEYDKEFTEDELIQLDFSLGDKTWSRYDKGLKKASIIFSEEERKNIAKRYAKLLSIDVPIEWFNEWKETMLNTEPDHFLVDVLGIYPNEIYYKYDQVTNAYYKERRDFDF